MSQDIAFNESASWYDLESTPSEPTMNDLDNTDQQRSILKDSLISTTLSELEEPPSDRSTSRSSPKMAKAKAKMLEYEDDQFDDNRSTHSLDSDFGGFDLPIIRSPEVKKALTSANEKLRHSTREKNPVSRFGYDYMDITMPL